MTIDDYENVRQVDILTQKQYLGQNFDRLSSEEQDKYLVSRKSEFKINLETGYGFVAVQDNTIVGFIFAHETLPFRGTLYIRHVTLKPDYQGHGIGGLLYKEVISKAKKDGIKKIVALINPDNPKSMKMHEKADFVLKDRKEAILEM